MYHEHGSFTSRSNWKYTYTGKDLLDSATNKFVEFREKERVARSKIAELMQNMKVSTKDEEIAQLKRDVEKFGKLREECAVFVHEFHRLPEREFHLSLGDVVFFDLAELAVDPDSEI